jgi:hypothetical protein
MSKAPARPNPKKNQQINVKFDDDFRERFLAACEIQQHREGQLARILIEWALPFYERARSVEALKADQGHYLAAPGPDVDRQTKISRKVFQRKKDAKDRKQSGN